LPSTNWAAHEVAGALGADHGDVHVGRWLIGRSGLKQWPKKIASPDLRFGAMSSE